MTVKAYKTTVNGGPDRNTSQTSDQLNGSHGIFDCRFYCICCHRTGNKSLCELKLIGKNGQ